ncbi:2-amino-1-hydroxyethylphosphonate dioxygenase (glycine-forming)-like isoform X2 [Homarus americanus]|nr:2-amino-1-hydroxyethylphosphonate dioxygenase (glycine-forming)-like isoform X2 [Homarus americanus]XP_042240163.1 2-amino-1-hydroxyethylphosphonate dioxygenase (glycine-forming)-like isoform X2 [Homarus americanus]XP_042240171.1 2-amino-1-hydroxyethylphosphonate dioxygenase (glycine-forming)-like isoform X2 [Homarus americanus]
MEPEAVVQDVFSLFEQFGEGSYIGEAVTQVQHALQAAHLAQHEGFPVETVLGALLHDIGHMLGLREDRPHMVTEGVVLGIANHEVLGEEYLERLGFPPAVTGFVRNHVKAKRFLVATSPDYYDALSDPSKMTLKHQGGPMTPQEVDAFRAHPQFQAILRMRSWDEKAKDPSAQTPSLHYYKNLCLAYLKKCSQGRMWLQPEEAKDPSASFETL